MAYNYDELFQSTPWALGDPTQVIVDHFSALDRDALSVLDIGCGQGRDAIFIAKLGHRVTGVDLSPHGIADLEKRAQEEKLPIKGIVADICDFMPDETYDIVLIDRTLHMLELEDRISVLQRLLGVVKNQGQVLIADEASNITDFVALLDKSWTIIHQKGGYLFAERG